MKEKPLNNTKRDLYRLCQDYLEQRIVTARQAIAASQQAANDETKSSSGDKYETGRAMMQLEVEKDSAQLSEALKLRYSLDQISIDHSSKIVQPGSIVSTNYGLFFLAISVGKLTLQGNTYMAISPGSPMGKKMAGLKCNDTFSLNERTYVIQEIE